MERILISQWGIYLVLGAFFLLVLKHFFNFKPKFLVPSSIKRIEISKYVLIVLVLLIFLQIKILTGKTIETQKDIPIQILFDVSLSMTADDIKPSRFDAAKMAVSSLMKELDGYSFSLISFSGVPFVYMPFSDDLNSMSLYRKETDLADFPPVEEFVGTAVGDALLLAMQNITSDEKKIVVLITDGDSNIGYSPLQLIPALQEQHIVVFALGVGEQDYLIGYDYFDTPVKTSINTALLTELAESTGGKSYRILDENSFWPVFEEIIDIVRAQEKDLVVDKYREMNRVLYVLIIVVLFYLCMYRLRFFFSHKK